MFARRHGASASFRLLHTTASLFFVLAIPVILALLPYWRSVVEASGTTYYVGCAAGNDSNSGTSESQAWKSLGKANRAPLRPGDRLLLKRGCTWTGPLNAAWNGTAAQPILISVYGSGTRPLIQNGYNSNVKITGSHQIIEYIRTRSDPERSDPGCRDQTVGWKLGFAFIDGASYNTVRHSAPTEHGAGFYVSSNSHHNKILNNTITGNNMMLLLDKKNPEGEAGGFGVLLNGNDNEVAYNYFSSNNTWCGYKSDGTLGVGDSAAIEIYKGKRNFIHHNKAIDQRTFAELGSNNNIPDGLAEDNIFVYNVHASQTNPAIFLIVRGANSSFGPNLRTKVFNNTIYLTGVGDARVEGVVCHAGCNSDILTLKNNIIWSEGKTIFADRPFNESNNIYWKTGGNPLVDFRGFQMSDTSKIVNPQFVSRSAGDLRLKPTSPAIDTGSSVAVNAGYASDFNQVPVPQGARPDIGAHEYSPVPESATPTPPARATPVAGKYRLNLPLISHKHR